MIVMKFGGTSVRNAEAMLRVAGIVERALDRKPVVVVSACAGVTNALQFIIDLSLRGEIDSALNRGKQLLRQHLDIIDQLKFSNSDARLAIERIFALLQNEIERYNGGGANHRRIADSILGFGEIASSNILYFLLVHRGLAASLIDAREIIITDERFNKASPIPELVQSSAASRLIPKIRESQVVVTQGFIGATVKGVPTTIGRGGSDYSATLMGAAIKAQEIQIWTDTNGILTSDPAVIPHARRIETISFDEAAEMAHFGAKVLHPNTIEPAKLAGIPLRVLNSAEPSLTGTGVGFPSDHTEQDATSPKGIAFKKGVTIVELKNIQLTKPYEFLALVFGVLADYRKSVGLVTTSSAGVSFTVDDEDDLPAIMEKLNPFAIIEIIQKRALIAVIGRFYRYSEEVATRVFSVLNSLNIRVDLVSFGGSEINLALAIDSDHLQQAVTAIHSAFFESAEDNADLSQHANVVDM